MIAIAIDGPAGAGKSSIAKEAAKALGFQYVDTGALYRTVALYLLRHEIDPQNHQAVEAVLPEIQVSLSHTPQGQSVFLCGEDVTKEIRSPQVSMASSHCSSIPGVRAFLLELQRELARRHDVLMDGRDIGTVVLPQAQVKIFLTASPEERARRRQRQLGEGGEAYQQILEEIRQRDHQDRSRAIAPLRPANDGVVLDTTGLTFEESCKQLLALVREKISGCDGVHS